MSFVLQFRQPGCAWADMAEWPSAAEAQAAAREEREQDVAHGVKQYTYRVVARREQVLP